MRFARSIFAALALAGCDPAWSADYALNTSSDWQSIIQGLTGTNVVTVADGTYAVTNWLLVPGYTTLRGTNREGAVFTGSGTCGVIKVNANGVFIHTLTVKDGWQIESVNGGGISFVSGIGNVVSNVVVSNCVAGSYNGGGIGGNRIELIVADSIVDGCRATNNTAGGILSATVTNCIVRNNSAKGSGGGLRTCSVYDSQVYSNFTANAGGGASGTGYAENTLFSSNRANGNGGGIDTMHGRNLTVQYNLSGSDGGGAQGGIITNLLARYNVAGRGGGAFGTTLYDSTIQSNTSAKSGGLGYNSVAHRTLLQGNRSTNATATTEAGGAADRSYLYNCLIVGNDSKSYSALSGGYHVYNCTIIGQTSAVPPVQFTNNYGFYNNVLWSNGPAGASNAIYNTTNANFNWTNDPLFIAGYIPTSTNVVDCGSGTYQTGTLDYLGRARVSGTNIDVGAVEYQSTDNPPRRRRPLWSLL